MGKPMAAVLSAAVVASSLIMLVATAKLGWLQLATLLVALVAAVLLGLTLAEVKRR